MQNQNPLLSPNDLAPFSQIKPEHIEAAITETLAHSKSTIESLLESNQNFTWQNLMQPMEELSNLLDKRWSPVSHMNAVVNSKELRTAYDACLPKLSEYGTWMGQNRKLYDAVAHIVEHSKDELDPIQLKILNDELRDFKLAGVSLPPEKQKRYGEIQKRKSELSSKFEQNLLDATMAWTEHFENAEQLSGIPESSLGLLKQNAEQAGKKGFLVNLEFPCYFAVMTYCDNRDLRYRLYRAYSTRASELFNEGEFDNTEIMNELITLRHELAELLDFSSYAELSLASKMAETPQQIFDFLQDLATRSKQQAEQDIAELKAFAEDQLNMTDLQSWDLLYISEKLKQQKYAISDELLRPNIPTDQVLKGLFAITEKLFAVSVEESKASFDSWHKDVRLFEVKSDGKTIARFYLDLYARAHKRGGAWMADYCSRFRQSTGELQQPVAYLTCNFNPPIGDKPALLTHDEVVTLFHEFGHGLHHMLTEVEYLSVSGINGVEWDAVELPSQFMENFCYEKAGLDLISGHFETGEVLPDDLREKLQAAKNFQSAMFMLRQIEFALFDFSIHNGFIPSKEKSIQHILDDVRKKYSVVIPPEWNRFQHTFSHIFAGGYSAGYYSYKWAEVLSADAFSLFEETEVLDPESGKLFKEHILQKGGSQPAMELFKNFRGREPDVSALLRHSGIQ